MKSFKQYIKESKFKLGSKVKLSAYGIKNNNPKKLDDENNPIGLTGEIVAIEGFDFEYEVEWSNGIQNSYDANELAKA